MRTLLQTVAVLGLAALFWLFVEHVAQVVTPAEPDEVVVATRQPPVDVPAIAEPVKSELIGESARRLAAAVESAGLLVHGLQDPQACLAKTGAQVRERKKAVHRWIDAAGIIHYSDQPPSADATEVRRIEVAGAPAVTVKATGYDVNLPDQLQQRAIADTQAIERVMRSSLGVENETGLALDIVFIASAETYAQRVGSPELSNSAGAYSSREKTIHIRLQDNNDANFVILRHEITHALLHERVGHLPVTINEGLAGYFERLEVSGMGAQIAFGNARDALATAMVSNDGADELVDLLATDGPAFYAEGREARYLRAFALVAVLMSRAEGRATLAALLAAQRADSCRPVDPVPLLDAGYPGGLSGLAIDWARWLRDPPTSVQAF